MGTDIEAAAIAHRLGRSPAVRRGAIADAALGLEGAVAGVVSVAAAGLIAPAGRQDGRALALRPALGCTVRVPRRSSSISAGPRSPRRG